jgi:hypothetical protein
MKIELVQAGEALALKPVDRSGPAAPVPRSLDGITAALAEAHRTLLFAELRSNAASLPSISSAQSGSSASSAKP